MSFVVYQIKMNENQFTIILSCSDQSAYAVLCLSITTLINGKPLTFLWQPSMQQLWVVMAKRKHSEEHQKFQNSGQKHMLLLKALVLCLVCTELYVLFLKKLNFRRPFETHHAAFGAKYPVGESWKKFFFFNNIIYLYLHLCYIVTCTCTHFISWTFHKL